MHFVFRSISNLSVGALSRTVSAAFSSEEGCSSFFGGPLKYKPEESASGKGTVETAVVSGDLKLSFSISVSSKTDSFMRFGVCVRAYRLVCVRLIGLHTPKIVVLA